MKLILSTLSLLVVSNMQCKKVRSDTPACILEKIKIFQAQPKQNPAATVEEYLYKGKKVYGFSGPCCDAYNEIVDEQCNYICAPSGGITGRGDGKCTDFATEAKLIRIVWRDNR
jgi:hypothetical protein